MTDDQAYELLCKAYADAAAASGLDPALQVEWTNVPSAEGQPRLYDGNRPWARHTVQWLDGGQATLGVKGGRRFERAGLVTVQLFAPAGKRGLTEAGALAKAARDAYEGEALGGVRLSDVKRVDVGLDGPWYQVNVVAAFEYDEVR